MNQDVQHKGGRFTVCWFQPFTQMPDKYRLRGIDTGEPTASTCDVSRYLGWGSANNKETMINKPGEDESTKDEVARESKDSF